MKRKQYLRDFKSTITIIRSHSFVNENIDDDNYVHSNKYKIYVIQ